MQCQDLLQRQDIWKNCTVKYRDEWQECLRQLQELEDSVTLLRDSRQKWSTRLRWASQIVMIIQNVIAGIAAVFPFLTVGGNENASKALGIIVFIVSATMWTNLRARAEGYLQRADDLDRVIRMSSAIRNLLRDSISDGIITQEEHRHIMEAMSSIRKAGEGLGGMEVILQILSQSGDGGPFVSQIQEIIRPVRKQPAAIDVMTSKLPASAHEQSPFVFQETIAPPPEITGGDRPA